MYRKIGKEGKLEIIDRYVDKSVIYTDHTDIYFNLWFSPPSIGTDNKNNAKNDIQELLRVSEQR